jgi:PAS domain S-box-containing protein
MMVRELVWCFRGLRTVVHTSPLAIYSADRRGKVTFWTRAAERMFGWTAHEKLGQPLPFIPSEGQQEHVGDLIALGWVLATVALNRTDATVL